MAPMDMERFDFMVSNGLHYQYMRNALQINNGNGYFSDVAYFSGIDKTDWSWGTLFGDYDNDGDNDLIVANGFLKDTQDKDFAKKSNDLAIQHNNRLTFQQASSLLKSTPLNNYAFRNNGNYQFENTSQEWGFDFYGFSNGVAHGDLDRDGDLDVVVNNINANVSLYENTINTDNFIGFEFIGSEKNKNGLHTSVTLHSASGVQHKEFQVARGFQSSVDHIVHFGLKPNEEIEKVEVVWANGKTQVINNPETGKYHEIKYSDSETLAKNNNADENKFFSELTGQKGLNYLHEEEIYDDFAREVLIPHKLSQLGPALAVADVNNDGLTDCYIGGAHQKAGKLF